MVEEWQQQDAVPVVITTRAGGRRAECVLGFHTRAGGVPEVHAVWLSRANRSAASVAGAGHLALHHLPGEDGGVAEHWSDPAEAPDDALVTTDWDPGPFGLPLLRACPERVVLERVEVIDVPEAEHLCWLGRVAQLG